MTIKQRLNLVGENPVVCCEDIKTEITVHLSKGSGVRLM